MIDVNGRVVMISGANRGIGLAIARNLYQAGYSLSLGARDVSSLNKIIDNATEDRILNSRFDAMDKSSHKDWVKQTIDKFNKIDCLINNAGIVESVSVEDEEDNEDQEDKDETITFSKDFWAKSIKICDFGISKLKDFSTKSDGITLRDWRSVPWTPPEDIALNNKVSTSKGL